MSTGGDARRFVCGGRGRNGTETPEQVTCLNCRRLLGLDKPLLPERLRTRKAVKVGQLDFDKSTGRMTVNVEISDANIAKAFKLNNLLLLARVARTNWMQAPQEEKHTAALNMADVLKGFLDHFDEKDTH